MKFERQLRTAPGVPAAGTAELSTELLPAEAALLRYEEAWRELAYRIERPNCFALPGFYRAWLQTLAKDVLTNVVVATRGSELCGILPIMRASVWRGPTCVPRHDYAPSDRTFMPRARRPIPLRQIASVTSMPAAMPGPALICVAADRLAVTEAFAKLLALQHGWDVLVLPAFDEEQPAWLRALQVAGLRPRTLPLHRTLQGLGTLRPFDDILAEQSRNFRKNVRRARTAAAECGMEIVIHEGRDAVTRRLEDLAAVAGASWKQPRRDGTTLVIPYEGQQRCFFETLLADADSGLIPVLAEAAVDGQPINMQLSLLHRASLTGVLTFWTGGHAAASPGLLTLAKTIDWAGEKGIFRFDFNATHDWVRHFADERRAIDNVFAFAPTLRGRTFGALSDATRTLKARLAR